MELITYMRGDAMAPEGVTLDLEPMLGRWTNTNRDTIYIGSFETWLEDERMMLRVFGVGDGAPVDWGAVEVQPFGNPATREPAGFHCVYRLDAADVLLAINYAKGILVIQTYTTFTDGSGRLNYQTREFFHRFRQVRPRPEPFPEVYMQIETLSYSRIGDLPAAGTDGAAPIDPGPYLGRWINSNPKSAGITGFTLERRGEKVVIRPEGADAPIEWGEHEVSLFAASVGGGALSAFNVLIDFGFMESFLAGNINLGLIVIAVYNRFKDDSGRADYFAREYYFHE